MKDLNKITKGITHSGSFHTDDVISTAFLKYFNPNIQIERVDQYDKEPEENEIVYDVGLGEFDHHQENRRIDDNKHPYCAFGLLWEVYGREYLKNNNFHNIEDAFLAFKKHYIYKMDIGDNEGYKDVKDFFENRIIMSCNSKWFEEEENIDTKQFNKAVILGSMILENWTRNIFNETEDHNLSF